jgi:hypothetical protein
MYSVAHAQAHARTTDAFHFLEGCLFRSKESSALTQGDLMTRPLRRRTLLIIGAVLAALVVVATVAFSIGLPGQKTPELAGPANSSSATAPPSSSAAPPPDSSASQPAIDARSVSQALQELAKDPARLMASDVKNAVSGNARDAIPNGSNVATEEESWAPDGLGGGTMIVTITPPNEPSQQYAAVMVKEDGNWKVFSTFVLGGTS